MKELLIKFWKDEEGATAIEYGLIAGLIAIVIIAAVSALGTNLGELFQSIADTFEGGAIEVPDAG